MFQLYTVFSKLGKNQITYRREAEHNMEVLSGASDEVIVEVLSGGRSARILLLHDGNELLLDLIDLIAGKQVGHLARHHFNQFLSHLD